MTSKKEKRAAGLAKREEFLKKEKEAGLLAQKRDRERRAAEESARDSTRRTNEWQKILDNPTREDRADLKALASHQEAALRAAFEPPDLDKLAEALYIGKDE